MKMRKTAAGDRGNGEAGADRPEDTPFLSGGERMRMQLSKAFAAPGKVGFSPTSPPQTWMPKASRSCVRI